MNAVRRVSLLAALVAAVGVSWAASETSQPLPENPVPYSRSSIQRGRVLYVHHCPICHGADGRALIEVIANATDLTAPARWRYGTSDGEIFIGLRDGVGVDMPGYATYIKEEEDLWHLVNYIRSLWPPSTRPELAPDPVAASAAPSAALP